MAVMELTDSNFPKEVLEAKLPVFVEFGALWCGPCQMAKPVVEELAREYEDKIKVGKLNVDENPQAAQKFGVMSIPTVVVFKNGQETGRKIGFEGKGEYGKLIDSVLSG